MQIGEIIATRDLHLLDQPGRVVKLLIGRPLPIGDDWCCPYQITGIGDEAVRGGMGVDALQALLLVASKALPAWAAARLEEYPTLRWEDAPAGEFGF